MFTKATINLSATVQNILAYLYACCWWDIHMSIFIIHRKHTVVLGRWWGWLLCTSTMSDASWSTWQSRKYVVVVVVVVVVV